MFVLNFIIRIIVPKHGPIKGIQNRTITKSGFSFLIFKALFIQLNGLIELTIVLITISEGLFPVSYCVLPGKRNDGYCNENE